MDAGDAIFSQCSDKNADQCRYGDSKDEDIILLLLAYCRTSRSINEMPSTDEDFEAIESNTKLFQKWSPCSEF